MAKSSVRSVTDSLDVLGVFGTEVEPDLGLIWQKVSIHNYRLVAEI